MFDVAANPNEPVPVELEEEQLVLKVLKESITENALSTRPITTTECARILSTMAHNIQRSLPAAHKPETGSSQFYQLTIFLFMAKVGCGIQATCELLDFLQAEMRKGHLKPLVAFTLAEICEQMALVIGSTAIPFQMAPSKCRRNSAVFSRHQPRAVEVQVACRIDLAGGWTDTPPITYQCAAPAVLNIAVTVDGKVGHST
jgi:hypothetical protein